MNKTTQIIKETIQYILNENKVQWEDDHAEIIKNTVEQIVNEYGKTRAKADADEIVKYLLTQKRFGTKTTNYMMDNIQNVSAGMAKALSTGVKDALESKYDSIFSKSSSAGKTQTQSQRVGSYLKQKHIGPR